MTREEVEILFKNKRERNYNLLYYENDIDYIKHVIDDHFRVTLTNFEIIEFWEYESESVCATWLAVRNPSDIINAFERFCSEFA